MKHSLLQHLYERKQRGMKSLAVLIDPDKTTGLPALLEKCKLNPPDLFLVGSSFKGDDSIAACIAQIRSVANVPVVLFRET